MTQMLEQFRAVFFEEAEEHLATLEHLLLTLDVQTPDPESLNGIFRAAHSIKGSAGMFGLEDITIVTHELETLLDRLRSGRMGLQPAMIDLFLSTRDVLSQLLEAHRQEKDDPSIPLENTLARLQELLKEPEAVGACLPTAGSDDYGFFDEPPEAEDESFGFFDEPTKAADDAFGLFEISGQTSGEHSEHVDTPHTNAEDELGQRDAQEGAPLPDTDAVQPSPAAASIRDFGLFSDAPGNPQAAPSYGLFGQAPGSPGAFEPPPVTPTAPSMPHTARQSSNEDSGSVRVGIEKIDGLINQVGELVITQAMLTQLTADLDPAVHERIHQALIQLEHNTRELQESVMSIRCLPISFIFNRFPRVVRDTAGRLGKQVRLILQGEQTELDKSVIEKLGDPLTHIIRNAIDHGIESPAERRALGKPESGTLRLAAFHQGGRIVVEIQDDGRGLNRERILAKAHQQGLPVSPELPDHDVWQLIFMPGFSTAEQVTDLSGRGVGMDVVRRNITAIGGRIDLDSMAGQGTRISIRLPLTLAIVDGMIVRAGMVSYVIPLTYIVESLQPAEADLHGMQGRPATLVRVRGEYLPLLRLHDLLQIDAPAPAPPEAIVLILEAESRKFALLVDDLVGQQQVVIKSLEQNFRRLDGLAGATIMGDGSVALILDIDALPTLAGQGDPGA